MAHFNLENELNHAIRMDLPVASDKRQHRKLGESRNKSITNISIDCSMRGEKTPMKTSFSQNKTPVAKTPKSNGKSTSGKAKKQPKTPKTPPANGDRFIPNRASTQFDLGYYKVMNENVATTDPGMMSPSQQEYQKIMNENLNGEILNSKIISYKSKPPTAPEGHQNNLKILYSSSKCDRGKKVTRHIPQVPDRILDAPEILDDYYLNLLDWSVNNQLAVALGGHLYLWNAGSGQITQLTEMEGPEEYISSVSWVKEGNFLAVGTSEGAVEIWDVLQEKRLRTMTGHSGRVGSLAWNSHILTSGSRSGHIHHHDVRVAQHQQGNMAGHTQEVCGLKWSPDGSYLASGGNDNLLNIWPADPGRSISLAQPIYTLTHHQAAVKALAWCPWQPRLLASGGGTADRHIHFWNCNTGVNLQNVDTKSQVCALLWSNEFRELISSHGFAQNQLIIWKYPTLSKVAELTGHTARVLQLAMSPDGSTVVSAGADETLRLWKCFAVPETKKTAQKSTSKDSSIARFSTIR